MAQAELESETFFTGPTNPGDGQQGRLGLDKPWPPPLCLDPWGLCDGGPYCVKLGWTVCSLCVFTEGLRSSVPTPEGELGDGAFLEGLGPQTLSPRLELSALPVVLAAPPFFSPFLWGSPKARRACISRNLASTSSASSLG